jgi:pimeloyl-ACP methyl ester carboxylesterase
MARFVLIHGAFGGSWSWQETAERLAATGHDAIAIDLPGHGSDPTPPGEVTLDTYADRVCEVLAEGAPAILIGQSMGGMVITQAAARCTRQVVALIYVAAFAPQEGQSLIAITQLPEAAGDSVQANLVVAGDPPIARMPVQAAPEALYHCAPPDRAQWAAQHLGPQPVAAFAQPLQVPPENAEAFAALPRAYVTCLQDRAIMPAMQRRMYEAAACDPVIEIDTDHSPWLSAPDELFDALERITASFS